MQMQIAFIQGWSQKRAKYNVYNVKIRGGSGSEDFACKYSNSEVNFHANA